VKVESSYVEVIWCTYILLSCTSRLNTLTIIYEIQNDLSWLNILVIVTKGKREPVNGRVFQLPHHMCLSKFTGLVLFM